MTIPPARSSALAGYAAAAPEQRNRLAEVGGPGRESGLAAAQRCTCPVFRPASLHSRHAPPYHLAARRGTVIHDLHGLWGFVPTDCAHQRVAGLGSAARRTLGSGGSRRHL